MTIGTLPEDMDDNNVAGFGLAKFCRNCFSLYKVAFSVKSHNFEFQGIMARGQWNGR